MHAAHLSRPCVPAGAPHHAPAGVIQQQGENRCNTRSRGLLLPGVHLKALLAHRNDREKQGCAQRLRRKPFGIDTGESARFHERRAQPGSGLIPQFDESPRLERGVIRNARRCGNQREQLLGGWRVRRDPRVGASRLDCVANAHAVGSDSGERTKRCPVLIIVTLWPMEPSL